MLVGRVRCPLLWAAALRTAQPYGVSLNSEGISLAGLRYDRLYPFAWVAGPLCLAGNPLLDRLLARLSTVASMAPGDVCQGPRCSLVGLGPAALGYRPCCCPDGSPGLPQCARPMGCGLLFPSLGCPRCARVCGVIGPLALVHQCARMVCSVCSVLGVLGLLAPVHWCARLVRCVACAVSWATWLLFTGVLARCVVLRVRCPGPLGYCTAVCPLSALSYDCDVLGHLAPVHRCARLVPCVACAVSWATWLLLTDVSDPVAVLPVRCPG